MFSYPMIIRTKLPYPHTRLERYDELNEMYKTHATNMGLRMFIGNAISDLLNLSDEEYRRRIDYNHANFTLNENKVTNVTSTDLKDKIKEIDEEVIKKFANELITVQLVEEIREFYTNKLKGILERVVAQHPELAEEIPFAYMHVIKGQNPGQVVAVPGETLSQIIKMLAEKE